MERAQIRAYLAKKHYDPENCSFEEKQKLMAALFRRGYSAGLIRTELGSSEDGDGGM
jgi:SOS response regulatory protein OraA/RecX